MRLTPEELVEKAFSRPRDARSPEYKEGIRARLWIADPRNQEPGPHRIQCPYAPGTTAFDAFYAGVDEGLMIWKQLLHEEEREEAAQLAKIRLQSIDTLATRINFNSDFWKQTPAGEQYERLMQEQAEYEEHFGL